MLQALNDLLSLLVELGWRLVEALELGLQISDKVGHVGGLEQLIFGLRNRSEGFIVSVFGEAAGRVLEEREDEVTVEEGKKLRQKIVIRHIVEYWLAMAGRAGQ